MSFRSLVRSTLLIGSSSAATAVVGVVRVKALALLLGPAGVGLLGAIAGVASVATALAALGCDTSGTRRLALDRENPSHIRRVRRALLVVALVHGLAAAAAFWWLREPIARLVLGDERFAFEVGLVGLASAFSVVAGLQIAQLQGLGRVGDIARINILACLGGTAIGVAAVAHWGLGGLMVLVLAQPLLAALLASRRTRGLGHAGEVSIGWRETAVDWRRLVAHGMPYMLSFLMLALVPLAVRALVIRDLGLEAAGHFHAAWTLSVIYVGFLLNAMSADYFPRLTAIAADRRAACALVNDQVKLALAIGGVALIGMLAGAPVLVPLLYSAAFLPAVELVEWQALGNILKIAGWPIAFMAMARGRALHFFLVELAWSLLLLALVWWLMPVHGLAATGFAFVGASAAFLALQVVLAYASFGFVLDRGAVAMLGVCLAAGLATLVAAHHGAVAALVVGGTLGLMLGLHGLRFILSRIGDEGRLVRHLRRWYARIGWPMPAAVAGQG